MTKKHDIFSRYARLQFVEKISFSSTLRLLMSISIIASLTLSCHSLKTPEFLSVENIHADKIGFSGSTLSADLHFYNPNGLGVELRKTDLDIYVNQSLLGHTAEVLKLKIPKKAKFVLPLSIHVDMKNLLKTGLTSQLKKNSTIKVVGSVYLCKGGIVKRILVDYTTEKDLSFFN